MTRRPLTLSEAAIARQAAEFAHTVAVCDVDASNRERAAQRVGSECGKSCEGKCPASKGDASMGAVGDCSGAKSECCSLKQP